MKRPPNGDLGEYTVEALRNIAAMAISDALQEVDAPQSLQDLCKYCAIGLHDQFALERLVDQMNDCAATGGKLFEVAEFLFGLAQDLDRYGRATQEDIQMVRRAQCIAERIAKGA